MMQNDAKFGIDIHHPLHAVQDSKVQISMILEALEL
jgi:hypothetical protein